MTYRLHKTKENVFTTFSIVVVVKNVILSQVNLKKNSIVDSTPTLYTLATELRTSLRGSCVFDRCSLCFLGWQDTLLDPTELFNE